MYKISTVPTGYQRVQERYHNLKHVKARVNQYLSKLDKNKRSALYLCYNSPNINFNYLNRLNMPNDLRSPVAHHCFKLALGISL